MMSVASFALAASVTPVSVVQQFQTIEQSLMDAITAGDRAPWERVMDADCVLTTEEGIASHVSVVTADPPRQKVSTDGWSSLAGRYQLVPDGWTFHVELQNGVLYGGRDPATLHAFIPLTPTSFVLQGSLGEWLFVVERDGKASRIVDFRKFEPLAWTRIE